MTQEEEDVDLLADEAERAQKLPEGRDAASLAALHRPLPSASSAGAVSSSAAPAGSFAGAAFTLRGQEGRTGHRELWEDMHNGRWMRKAVVSGRNSCTGLPENGLCIMRTSCSL